MFRFPGYCFYFSEMFVMTAWPSWKNSFNIWEPIPGRTTCQTAFLSGSSKIYLKACINNPILSYELVGSCPYRGQSLSPAMCNKEVGGIPSWEELEFNIINIVLGEKRWKVKWHVLGRPSSCHSPLQRWGRAQRAVGLLLGQGIASREQSFGWGALEDLAPILGD